jgi:hypothetical protein
VAWRSSDFGLIELPLNLLIRICPPAQCNIQNPIPASGGGSGQELFGYGINVMS